MQVGDLHAEQRGGEPARRRPPSRRSTHGRRDRSQGADIRSHRSSPRFSLHTSLVRPDPSIYPPHTTSPGKVRSHSFAPTRATLHTRISRQAPTSPLCSATRAHRAGRAATREAAQPTSASASSDVVVVSADHAEVLPSDAIALSAFCCCMCKSLLSVNKLGGRVKRVAPSCV